MLFELARPNDVLGVFVLSAGMDIQSMMFSTPRRGSIDKKVDKYDLYSQEGVKHPLSLELTCTRIEFFEEVIPFNEQPNMHQGTGYGLDIDTLRWNICISLANEDCCVRAPFMFEWDPIIYNHEQPGMTVYRRKDLESRSRLRQALSR